MNFLRFAFPLALLVAVQLTTLTWAATNVTKTSGKDYDEQGEHLGEQPVRRVVPACDLDSFSLGDKKPTFPEQPGVILPLCPDNQYAIFYNNSWGIARYTLYKITAAQALKAKTNPVPRPNDPWQLDETPGIRQGSGALYQSQPFPGRYHKGHLVPVNILRYSDESVRATFTYTNCVPQIGNFNTGQWKKYELKIGKYAQDYCAPIGGTLYLITGTSRVKFDEKLNLQGEITGADKSKDEMELFHDKADAHQKIEIPNSMWTVGCCLNLKTNQVVGAFGVMGDNFLNKKPLNKFMMSQQNVAYVESALKLEDPTIKLFPKGKDCYMPEKNVKLNEIHR